MRGTERGQEGQGQWNGRKQRGIDERVTAGDWERVKESGRIKG